MEKNKDNCTYTYLTISAQLGLVDQVEYFDRQIGSKDSSNYYILRKGQFAYNKSYSNGYPYGAIKQLENYDNGILSPLYICFSLNEDKVNSEYIKQFFESSIWHRYIDSICTEGARNHGILNIAVGDFFNMPITLPTMEMQIKYGKLLSSIDDLIDTSKKLLSENENLITGYYQQIIENEVAWKVYKINELFKVTRGSVLSKENMSLDNEKYPVYSSQTTNNGLLGYYSDYLYENAITWTTDGANAGDVNYRHGKFYCTNVCGVLLSSE